MPGAYSHTQKGIIQPLLLVGVLIYLTMSLFLRSAAAQWTLILAAVALAVLSFAFRTLTIEGGEDRLLVRFGPLPLFRKSIPYREIVSVTRERSSFLAGWGVHWTRRGWLWNIGGFDCVRVNLEGGKGTLLGTDDPEGLLAFLRERTGAG